MAALFELDLGVCTLLEEGALLHKDNNQIPALHLQVTLLFFRRKVNNIYALFPEFRGGRVVAFLPFNCVFVVAKALGYR